MLIGLGTATLDYGQLVSAAAARRMACDCKLIPVVLGSDSEPLDVGRAMRTVPVGMRRALIARDGGCAFPSCDRPPGLCQAHHCRHWIDGGQTAVQKLLPFMLSSPSPSTPTGLGYHHPRRPGRIPTTRNYRPDRRPLTNPLRH